MKIKVNREIQEEIEIEFPIYAAIDYDDYTEYYKLTEFSFVRITQQSFSNEISIYQNNSRHKHHSISKHIIDNQCSREQYSDALNSCKERIKKLYA